MFSWWALLAVLAGVAVASVLFALACGWRPGRPPAPTEADATAAARRRSGLGSADWRRVQRAVRRGEAAPEPLRPAAYDLATALTRHRESSRWPLSRRTLLVIGAGYYALVVIGFVLFDGFDRAVLLRPLPMLAFGALLVRSVDRQHAHTRTARTRNAP